MSDKVPIRDGPAEGLQTSPGEKYVWLEVVVIKRSERTEGAGLYELVDGAYQYIGGLRSECAGCGAYYVRAEADSCPLCGYARAAA